MVRSEWQDGVAAIVIDNPPVNALSTAVSEAIAVALEEACTDPEVQAIVLLGAGRTFVAGADIRQLEQQAWGESAGAPNLHELLQRIEDCPKPVVMAIHGTALGGGLEIAMAGPYRIATRDSLVGQPEVNLGIIPGAEGTQRLPRLAGIENAIQMCVTGKLVKAPEALGMGILDAMSDVDLRTDAFAFARNAAASGTPLLKTREREPKLKTYSSLEDALAEGESLAAKQKKNLTAPNKAIEAIRAASTLPFDLGCARERELFDECVNSDQCRALIHVFFAERSVARIPGLPAGSSTQVFERVGIVGAGTMGCGIAMACANAGLEVLLKDSRQEALSSGLATIRKYYETSLKRGRLTQEEIAQRLARIHLQLDYADFERLDVAVEAVFEDFKLKRTIFQELDSATRPDCILASNTSSLDIDKLAQVTRNPERVIGLHFFSPANVMRLLEIVRGRSTSIATVATALAISKRLSKIGVVVRNGPGFVGNRMMFPYMYETQFLVEEGATPEQVDTALRRFGMAMGMFEVDDMAGLDVAWRVRQEMGHFQDAGARRPVAADRLFALGRYGQKTGKGWYRYDEDRKPVADPEVLELIRNESRKAEITQRQFSDEEIVERSFLGMINEGARLLKEGVALRASDIDIIYVNGYGFPAWRGGPMFYADCLGLPHVVARLGALERELGSRWSAAPLLCELADSESSFREFDKSRQV